MSAPKNDISKKEDLVVKEAADDNQAAAIKPPESEKEPETGDVKVTNADNKIESTLDSGTDKDADRKPIEENKIIEVVKDSSDTGVMTEESSNTKWIVVIVVLVLLIIALGGGAFYYFTQYKFVPKGGILSPVPDIPIQTTTPTPTAQDEMTKQLKQVGTGDEMESIVGDLENTNLDNIDKELGEIEGSLKTP